LVADIEATVGPIGVLVNNVGYGHEGVLEESPLAEMRRQFDVNVFGSVVMIKAVLPYMRTRRRGHILNITSMGGSACPAGRRRRNDRPQPARGAGFDPPAAGRSTG
jgi:short-subunit dehydrogenase